MAADTESEARADSWRPWVIVGCGRLGRALGVAARTRGVEVRATWNRTEERAAESDRVVDPVDAVSGELPGALEGIDLEGTVVWLTVVDDAVEDVARKLAGRLGGAALALHTAGALDAGVLERAGLVVPVGSLHPLLAATDPERAAQRFGDVAWSAEGSPRALEFARTFADAFGAQLVELPAGARPLYHASAVTAANLLVALADAAFEMAERAGLSRERAREILVPLMQSSVANLEECDPAGALSGPVARGDDGTIDRHLEALEGDPRLRSLYEILTERARELVDSGASEE